MGHRFADIAFTPAVRALQSAQGSRGHYARQEGGSDSHDVLTLDEATFIEERDSFYMATVSETGWPYVQHRGGPPGFLRVIDKSTLGFADLRGNRQYVSVGNLATNDRVALILVDYPARTRLKVLGHVEVIPADRTELVARLVSEERLPKVERAILIHVAAYDWNCPQYITPRYSQAQFQATVAPLHARIQELEAQVEALTRRPPASS